MPFQLPVSKTYIIFAYRKYIMRREHMLIIRFSRMEDIAAAVPVVEILANTYPHLRITFLSRPAAREMFANLAPNVSFMGADLKFEYHGVKGMNALYRRLTAKRFTAIADLHNVLRSEYLRLRFNLDRYKVAHLDKHKRRRLWLLSPLRKKQKARPTQQDYADVFAHLGYPVDLE